MTEGARLTEEAGMTGSGNDERGRFCPALYLPWITSDDFRLYLTIAGQLARFEMSQNLVPKTFDIAI